jgi:ABC-type bacteriocin/lantibiotic exporter with double-glycine peptidase domain
MPHFPHLKIGIVAFIRLPQGLHKSINEKAFNLSGTK